MIEQLIAIAREAGVRAALTGTRMCMVPKVRCYLNAMSIFNRSGSASRAITFKRKELWLPLRS